MKISPYIIHTLVAGVAAIAIAGTLRASGSEPAAGDEGEAVFAEVVNPPVPSSMI